MDHLAAVKSIQVTLPDEPEGRCSNALQVNIQLLLDYYNCDTVHDLFIMWGFGGADDRVGALLSLWFSVGLIATHNANLKV